MQTEEVNRKIEPMIDHIAFHETLPFFSKIVYYSLKGVTGFSARDFITVVTALKLSDGRRIIVGSSI